MMLCCDSVGRESTLIGIFQALAAVPIEMTAATLKAAVMAARARAAVV